MKNQDSNEKRYTKTVSVPISQETFDYLDLMSKERDLSKARIVRGALDSFCKLNEDLI
jgi:predicted DNA-binding protein